MPRVVSFAAAGGSDKSSDVDVDGKLAGGLPTNTITTQDLTVVDSVLTTEALDNSNHHQEHVGNPQSGVDPHQKTSLRSTGSTGSAGSSSGGKSSSLRSNLTRQNTARDPWKVYDLLRVLGEGSMGRVCQVRKKAHKIGESARYNLEAREAAVRKWDECFALPLGIGWLCRQFLGQHAEEMIQKASLFTPVGEEEDDGDEDDNGEFGTMSPSQRRTQKSSNSSSVASPSPSTESTAPPVAMKSIHLRLMSDPVYVQELQNEIAVLKTLDHPNIVRVTETFEYEDEVFVVMECCTGGDLYTHDPYTEDAAARILYAVLSAVSYMHSKGV